MRPILLIQLRYLEGLQYLTILGWTMKMVLPYGSQ